MRISDRSSDVCSSDLEFEGTETSAGGGDPGGVVLGVVHVDAPEGQVDEQVVEDLLHLPAVAELDLVAVAVAPEDAVRLEDRSEERRVGKECVSRCRSRWSPCP